MTPPRGRQDGSKTAQATPKTAQEAPRTAQEAPKTAQEAPKTLQERLPDIDLRSGMARAWAGWSLLGAEGPPGRGVGGREKLAKNHAQDLNTPMGRRPGEFGGPAAQTPQDPPIRKTAKRRQTHAQPPCHCSYQGRRHAAKALYGEAAKRPRNSNSNTHTHTHTRSNRNGPSCGAAFGGVSILLSILVSYIRSGPSRIFK